MMQLDPLSYHQMPLAVPGSFLPKCKYWLPRYNWNVESGIKH
jgi:hypothetical protein